MSETLTAPAAAHHEADDHAHATVTGISNEKLAMWLFLGSECLLFGGLISTYMLYKNRPVSTLSDPGVVGAKGGIAGLAGSPKRVSELFDIPFTSASSFVLLASSLTMVFAVSSAMRKDQGRMRLWLVTTAVLGGVFVGGQIYEFTSFVREGLGFTSNVAASAFFTLTGFHGVHVTVGILMLLFTAGLSLRGRLPDSKAEAVEIVGLYWHFVDVVWILIFTVVYLIK